MSVLGTCKCHFFAESICSSVTAEQNFSFKDHCLLMLSAEKLILHTEQSARTKLIVFFFRYMIWNFTDYYFFLWMLRHPIFPLWCPFFLTVTCITLLGLAGIELTFCARAQSMSCFLSFQNTFFSPSSKEREWESGCSGVQLPSRVRPPQIGEESEGGAEMKHYGLTSAPIPLFSLEGGGTKGWMVEGGR